MATNYEYVGTLKSGKHTVLDLDKTFYAGDEVPLTESQAANFAHRFNNIRKVDTPDLAAAEKAAAEKAAAEKAAAEKAAAEKAAAEKAAAEKAAKGKSGK